MNAPAVGTVICATLRVSDLLPAFAAELEHLDPVTAAEVIGPYERWGLEYTREWIDENWEEALEMLTTVADQLERIGAENGYTFGAHEGDGSDFGFWKGEQS